MEERKIVISGGSSGPVSGVVTAPSDPTAAYLFAHGAGAGMNHSFMKALAVRLGERGLATLRYNFPYMEKGGKRPDFKPILHATVRHAVAAAATELPALPLYAGGKSFGGRMTSEAQASEALPGVRGLIFVGFPLHPPGKEGIERAEHLPAVQIPMLFLQGTRDKLADLELIRGVTGDLGPRATLAIEEGADHGFHVLKSSGRTDAQVMDSLADRMAAWVGSVTRTAS